MLLVELTLLPALLSIVGPRLFWPSRLRRAGGTGAGGDRRPGRAAAGPRPRRRVLILGGLSAFLVGYAPSGFDPGGSIAGSDSSLGQYVLEEHFGEIAVGATDVVFRFPSSVWTNPFLLEQAEDGLWTSGRLSSVTGALDAGGRYLPPRAVARLYTTLGPPQRLPLVDTKELGGLRPPSTTPTGPPGST